MLIDHLDLVTRCIHLKAGVREYHPVDDIYKEVRYLRRTNEAYRGTHTPVIASGNVPKGGGKFTPRLATFQCGWKIVPEDTSHVLFVTGEQITSEGESGPAVIDFGPLSPSSKVVVQYEPPSAEVIVVSGNGDSPEIDETLRQMKEKLDEAGVAIDIIRQIETGRWKIQNNQMIFYDKDDKPLRVFNLKDKDGKPAMKDVYERVPV